MTWTERSEKTLEIWSEIDKPTIWFEKEGGKQHEQDYQIKKNQIKILRQEKIRKWELNL